MRGQLSINGWQFVRNVRLTTGLYSSHYRHAESGFTAEETFAGPKNRRLGLLIRDNKGKAVGLVQDVKGLP